MLMKLTPESNKKTNFKNCIYQDRPTSTQYFCTQSQYCDKKIKRHFDKNIFFLKNIVVAFLYILKLGFNKHNCPKKSFQFT